MSAVRHPLAAAPLRAPRVLHLDSRTPVRRSLGSLLDLVQRVQRSLDPCEVLVALHESLVTRPDYQGLEYRGPALAFAVGDAAFFTCEYTLQVDEEPLGCVQLHFDSAPEAGERARVEARVNASLPSLRNALAHERLRRQARQDAMTGLLNRNALEIMLPREIALAQRERLQLSVVLFDLDHFKYVNDSNGHQAGDRVLIDVARIAAQTLRESDLAFRFGGDEFLVVLPDTDADGAARAAQRLRDAVATDETICARLGRGVSLSAGVSTLAAGDDAERLLARADRALYGAKDAGRNCCVESRKLASISSSGSSVIRNPSWPASECSTS